MTIENNQGWAEVERKAREFEVRYVQTREYIENQIALKQLKFERAIEAWDIDTANIACAQKAYYEQLLAKNHP